MKNAGMAGAVALVGIGRVVPPCSDRLRLVATRSVAAAERLG